MSPRDLREVRTETDRIVLGRIKSLPVSSMILSCHDSVLSPVMGFPALLVFFAPGARQLYFYIKVQKNVCAIRMTPTVKAASESPAIKPPPTSDIVPISAGNSPSVLFIRVANLFLRGLVERTDDASCGPPIDGRNFNKSSK